MSKGLRVCVVALMTGLWSLSLWAQETRGTLVFDVKPFTSEVTLKEKIENQLKTGGVEWGVAEGQLVVSLEVHPTIQKKSTFFVTFFTPELLVRVIEQGVSKTESVINERTDASIAWEDYNGPLKF